MDAFNLLLPDGSPSKVWVCGACRLTCPDEAGARQCCTLIPCDLCGEPTESKYRLGYERAHHVACERRDRARKDMERIERAEKLESWDGPVWADGHRGDMGDGYFSSLGSLVDHLVDEFDPDDHDRIGWWPEWVYVCDVRHPFIDVGDVLENVLDDGWEDMDEDNLNGVKELAAAIKAFNEANKSVNIYDADMGRVVRVPRYTDVIAAEGGDA